MTEKKVTKREKYEMLLAMDAVKGNEMLAEFVKHEIELLDNKNSTRKPSATQKANEELKDLIVAEVTANPNKLYSITDLLKAIQPLWENELTNQKMSALVRQLRLDGKIERVEDKRKAFFKLA